MEIKVSCIGLNSILGNVDKNLIHAKEKILQAIEEENPDVIVLPELFTTGFYPKDIQNHVDFDGVKTKEIIGKIAKEKNVNIVAGSIANKQGTNIYNTSLVFDRQGAVISSYNKTHLFTNMNEEKYFSYGENVSFFELDKIKCGIIICYDLRFSEFVNKIASKIDLLFIVSAWPKQRLKHLQILSRAKAIENQIFVSVCNSSSQIKSTKFAGNSMLINPLGEILAKGDENEHIISASLDFNCLEDIQKNINVKKDKRENLYKML